MVDMPLTPRPLVALVMGSRSDYPQVDQCVFTLSSFNIPHEVRILSAHRTPDAVARYASEAEVRGLQVIIAAAGGAAHLAGVIAANTILPVIGIPVPATSLQGQDALLSTVQMPAGVPVATMAIAPAGATNAALLAMQIIARSDKLLAQRLHEHKRQMHADVLRRDQEFNDQTR